MSCPMLILIDVMSIALGVIIDVVCVVSAIEEVRNEMV